MERILFFLTLVLLSFYSTCSIASHDSCTINGYSRAQITARETQLLAAFKDRDTAALVNWIDYPLLINLKSGTRTIATPQAFLKLKDAVFAARDVTSIAAQLTHYKGDVICRADGVGLIQGGMWLSPFNLKIKTLNRNAIPHTILTVDQPMGHPIHSLTDRAALAQFAQQYNALQHESLRVIATQGGGSVQHKVYQLHSQSHGYLNLYKADINNTGTPKYILVYMDQGSIHADGIVFIGLMHNQKLIPIHFENVIQRNFHIDLSKWYIRYATPFLTYRKWVYLNYLNNNVTCTYLWKDQRMTLITQDRVNCIATSESSASM